MGEGAKLTVSTPISPKSPMGDLNGVPDACTCMAGNSESELLAYLSHELRTGLHAMVGHAQLLQLDGIDGDGAASVERIIDTGFYLAGLLEEVSELANSELRGDELIMLEPLEIEPLMQQLVALVGPLAGARQVTIDVDPVAPDASWVKADRRRLTQILLNLLSNAIKYGGAEGRVRLSAERRDDRVVVCVSDTGPGIAADRLQDLFEPFERLGAERGPAPGSGLGLALSKRIAAATSAQLTLESSGGEGTTFALSLAPASDLAEAAA
jgi:signal transduction histidine kinase